MIDRMDAPRAAAAVAIRGGEGDVAGGRGADRAVTPAETMTRDAGPV